MKMIAIRCLIVWTLFTVFPAYGDPEGNQFTSFAGFKLGTVTLAQVKDALGPVTLVETGDAGEYVASICYRTPTGLVYFLSGEMGGQDHDLLGFGLSRSDAVKTKSCAKWPFLKAVPSLVLGGLRLGMTKMEFSKVVATEVRWDNGVAYADFESKRKMTRAEIKDLPKEVQQATMAGVQQDYFDVVVSIMGVFKNGKLSELRGWKIESM